MAKGRWRTLAPGFEIREAEDGQVEGRYRENVAGLLRENAELRKATKKNTKVGNMGETSYLRSRHGITHEIEMIEKCGADPELRAAYLRDHPELQAAPRSKIPLPKKRSYSFSKRLRPNGGRK